MKDGKKPLTNNGGEGNLLANNCPKAGIKSTGALLLDSKEASKCLRPFEALTLEGRSDSFSWPMVIQPLYRSEEVKEKDIKTDGVQDGVAGKGAGDFFPGMEGIQVQEQHFISKPTECDLLSIDQVYENLPLIYNIDEYLHKCLQPLDTDFKMLYING